MKVYIMTDLEGVAGVLNAEDWIYRDSRYLDRGQALLAGEVNAAICGLFDALEWRFNGTSIGEYGAIVYTAGFYGTPAIFASGERAFCDEVKGLTPWAHTVEVKRGVTRDNGANCSAEEYKKHNLGAVHVHPEVARERIYNGAKAALLDFKANPEKFKALCPEPPFTCERWYRRQNGNPAYKTIMKNRTDVADAIYGTPDEILYEGAYEPPYPYVVEENMN